MVDRRRLAIAVLAAGASRRFGAADKLTADFCGRPLGEHASAAVPIARFAERWIITSDPKHPCRDAWKAAGFDLVHNSDAISGMGTSVALAARKAAMLGCDALMIALADMPFVPATHFEAILDGFGGPNDIAASCKAGTGLPPAIFGANHFDRLSRIQGDFGARGLLSQARIIPCPDEWLIDIDRPQDLRTFGS